MVNNFPTCSSFNNIEKQDVEAMLHRMGLQMGTVQNAVLPKKSVLLV